LSLAPVAVQPANALTGTVREVVWQGDQISIDIDVVGNALRVVALPMHTAPAVGSELTVHFGAENATLIPYEEPS